MCTINVNVVRGYSYEKFFTQKIIIQVSLHESFQIYSTWDKYSSSQKKDNVFVVPPSQDGVAPFTLAVPFPFHMHTRTIGSNGRGLVTCKNR